MKLVHHAHFLLSPVLIAQTWAYIGRRKDHFLCRLCRLSHISDWVLELQVKTHQSQFKGIAGRTQLVSQLTLHEEEWCKGLAMPVGDKQELLFQQQLFKFASWHEADFGWGHHINRAYAQACKPVTTCWIHFHLPSHDPQLTELVLEHSFRGLIRYSQNLQISRRLAWRKNDILSSPG